MTGMPLVKVSALIHDMVGFVRIGAAPDRGPPARRLRFAPLRFGMCPRGIRVGYSGASGLIPFGGGYTWPLTIAPSRRVE